MDSVLSKCKRRSPDLELSGAGFAAQMLKTTWDKSLNSLSLGVLSWIIKIHY
jgi:hypothetical protein